MSQPCKTTPRKQRRTYTVRDLPETGFIRLPTVLSVLPIGKTAFWHGVKTGKFPSPVKLGPRTTAWRVEDIHALIERLGAA